MHKDLELGMTIKKRKLRYFGNGTGVNVLVVATYYPGKYSVP